MLGSGRVFQPPMGMDIGLQLLHPLSVHGFMDSSFGAILTTIR